jgi:hypothetical protein
VQQLWQSSPDYRAVAVILAAARCCGKKCSYSLLLAVITAALAFLIPADGLRPTCASSAFPLQDINTGAVGHTDQQNRKAAYHGSYTTLLDELAANRDFLNIQGREAPDS